MSRRVEKDAWTIYLKLFVSKKLCSELKKANELKRIKYMIVSGETKIIHTMKTFTDKLERNLPSMILALIRLKACIV
jgi:hypothetical protein